MFRVVVLGKTVKELKDNLLDMATALKDANQIEKEEIEESYEHPQTVPDYVPSKVEQVLAQDSHAMMTNIPFQSPAPQVSVPITAGLPVMRPVTQAETPPSMQVHGAERDSKGFPWDSRIHSATKALNKDGSWRYRRNIDDALVAQVEGELRQGMQKHTAETVATMYPSAPVIPPMPFSQPAAPAPVVAQPAPAAPTLAVVPPAAQPVAQPAYENIPVPETATTPAHSFETFKAQLIQVIAALVGQKKIDQEYVKQLCEFYEVSQIWLVKNDDNKARSLFDLFTQSGLITKVD